MEKDLPPKLDRESLKQLATEQLVELIMEQAIANLDLNPYTQTNANSVSKSCPPFLQNAVRVRGLRENQEFLTHRGG
jgi:hypothetical protein